LHFKNEAGTNWIYPEPDFFPYKASCKGRAIGSLKMAQGNFG